VTNNLIGPKVLRKLKETICLLGSDRRFLKVFIREFKDIVSIYAEKVNEDIEGKLKSLREIRKLHGDSKQKNKKSREEVIQE
jgi:hypothetical protein